MVAVFTTMMGKPAKNWEIYPYLNDFWTNQVTCETRFHQVQIPDVDLTSNIPRISWTVADFLEVTKVPEEASSYDVVVTCFFLDTATNVLDYIHAIHSVLVSGGRWINAGPLHWHANARIVLTVEELRVLFEESRSWKVIEWMVDIEPLEYRSGTISSDGAAISTRYEAYRPLRFVLEKR
jgi:hypothetical protein